MIRYARLDDYINKKTFRLINVPATYGPQYACFMDEETSVGPIYMPWEGETANGRFTIADMIDMNFNKVGIEFANRKDIYEVEFYLKAYINDLESVGQLSREHAEYLNRAKNFLHDIEKAARAVRRYYKEEIPETTDFLAAILKEKYK